MSVQGEINQALGVVAKTAAIAKGFSMAEQQKQEKADKEKAKAEKEAKKEAEKKQADALKAQQREQAEKKAADKEAVAMAKEKKIQDRQDLLFLEQSQNKVEAQRRAIAGIDKKLPELEGSIAKYQKASRYKRSGKQAMAEARASLEDALEQRKTLQADRSARYTLLKQREQMMANARKEFNYGEE